VKGTEQMVVASWERVEFWRVKDTDWRKTDSKGSLERRPCRGRPYTLLGVVRTTAKIDKLKHCFLGSDCNRLRLHPVSENAIL